VPFNFSGFLPPLSQNLAFGLNRTIPIKFQLTDLDGSVITSLSAVTSLKVAPVLSGGGLGTPFNPTPSGGTGLQNDGTQYIFNWQTKGLAAGSYEILLALSDGSAKTKVVQLSANGKAGALLIDGSTTTAAVGSLLGGNIDVYVDNSNVDLTADELARIQDAVTAADAVTEPYGVAVTEVTDPTLADVTLNMDTTSAVGGYADGVLGCTTDSGQITVINGWNFYAGTVETQIGSGQYDFQTVVTHELGHALGLGHSADSASVMYASLNTGVVNRSLSVADLNVADTDNSACGLHVATPDARPIFVSPPVAPAWGGANGGIGKATRSPADAPGSPWWMLTTQKPLGVLPPDALGSDAISLAAKAVVESKDRAGTSTADAAVAHDGSWSQTGSIASLLATKRAARDTLFALGIQEPV
jgi:predicted Zn-dependent protease